MTMRWRWLMMWLAAALLSDAGAADPPQTARARALFDEYWEWTLREFPTYATLVGDSRYDDRFTDYSPAAVARRKSDLREFLRRLRTLDRAALSGQDAVSRDVLATTLALQLGAQSVFDRGTARGADLWREITRLDGPQLGLPDLVQISPFRTVRDYENYVARLHAVPRLIVQLVAGLRRAVRRGWLLPAGTMQQVPAQIDALLAPDPAATSLYAPFRRFPPAVPAAERERLTARGRGAITQKVQPAFRALRAFLVDEYLPQSAVRRGARAQPGYVSYYKARIAEETTSRATPAELHALGLREVERIERAMQQAIAATGFRGTRAEFIAWQRASPQSYCDSADELLDAYRDIARRVDPWIPKLFAEPPRRGYAIRGMPAAEGDNAERYIAADAAGTRPGYFEANTNNLRRRPKGEMVATFLHEAVPGHHLQIARAQELDGVPAFRKYGLITAYVEGWGLYAESLGEDMGLYGDPHARFGYLTLEMWRAARLVVDTGIHAYGWSRERAIRYMNEVAGLDEPVAEAEVDRYFGWPGQALAYKVGQLRIKALRERAQAALGERFDLRKFHDAVLDNGPLPLSVLESRVERWIARIRREAAAQRPG